MSLGLSILLERRTMRKTLLRFMGRPAGTLLSERARGNWLAKRRLKLTSVGRTGCSIGSLGLDVGRNVVLDAQSSAGATTSFHSQEARGLTLHLMQACGLYLNRVL